MSIKVFLSSRFEEFKDLRKKIIEEFKSMHQLGIEIINLDDNKADIRSPLSRSLDNITESDYMIFLLGETYGSIQKQFNKSYIHLEYEKAISKNTKTKVLSYTIGDSYIEERYADDINLKFFQENIQKNGVCSKYPSNYDLDEIAKAIRNDFQNAIRPMLANNPKKIKNKKVINEDINEKPTKNIRPLKNFNMIDELLSINYKNRKRLIDDPRKGGIRYEFWECKSPAKQYFLIFFPSSSIKKSILDFLQKYEIDNKQLPKEITILKETDKTQKTTFEEFTKRGIRINEYSYSTFLWDLCIDQDFKNKKHSILVEPNYINQDFYTYENNTDIGSSSDIVNNFIKEDSSTPVMAIIAQAGVGKTTFLEYLTKKINYSPSKQCIYISSEDFKEHYGNFDVNKLSEITSIYDFYNIYIRMDNYSNMYHLDENIFNIGLFNGNIIIVIDGLDEIITLYQDKFHLDKFIDSLVELNKQLGKCKILISSREYYWAQNQIMHRDEIVTYKLQGFTKELLNTYLGKRYSQYNSTEKKKYINTIKRYLNEVDSITDNKIYTPFVVDIICQMVEDQLDEELEEFGFDDNNDLYPNNNETIDNVIFSILKREIIRQSFQGLNVIDLIDIFIDLAVDYGELLSKKEFEEAIEIKHPTTYKKILQSLTFSPLLKIDVNSVSFKYDILKNYFICLYLINMFNFAKHNKCPSKHLSKLFKAESPIFKDVKKYFQNGKQDIFMNNAKEMIQCLINKYKKLDLDNTSEKSEIEHSISSILYLLISINGEQLSIDKKIDLIMKLYNSDDKLEYLFIFGEFYELDFSNIKIWNSKFDGYTKFFNSKFDRTEFYYTQFINMRVSSISIEMTNNAKFDETCELFELSKQLRNVNGSLNAEEELRSLMKHLYKRNQSMEYRIKKNNEYKINQMNCLLEHNFVTVKEQTIHLIYELQSDKAFEIKQYMQNSKISKNIRNLLKCLKKSL